MSEIITLTVHDLKVMIFFDNLLKCCFGIPQHCLLVSLKFRFLPRSLCNCRPAIPNRSPSVCGRIIFFIIIVTSWDSRFWSWARGCAMYYIALRAVLGRGSAWTRVDAPFSRASRRVALVMIPVISFRWYTFLPWLYNYYYFLSPSFVRRVV